MAAAPGKSIVQKLGIKPGFRIFVGDAPADYRDIVGTLPEQVTIVSDPAPPLQMLHLFATNAATLAGRLRLYRDIIAPDGMIWVSWPKKASGVATDLTDVVVRQTALALDLVDTKVCAINEIWSGLKFVVPRDLRPTR